jgi:microcystin-dependent protein
VLARTSTETYASATDGTDLAAGVIGNAGGNVPHTNIQPYVVVTFCIALVGAFPSRN